MYDDDDTQFEAADEATLFEPCPWGSRQRCMPRARFKAAVSVVAPKSSPLPIAASARIAPAVPSPRAAPARLIELAVPSTRMAPAFSSQPLAFVEARPRDRERYIATERVPRVSLLTPKPSRLRRRLAIAAVPLAALALGGVLALVFARPAAPRAETASPLARIDEPADDPVYVVTSVEQPPAAPTVTLPRAAAPTVTLPTRRATIVKSARVLKRPALAFDTSTPLGDLAHRRR